MASGVDNLLDMLRVDSARLLLRNISGALPLDVIVANMHSPMRTSRLLFEHSSGLVLLCVSVHLVLSSGLWFWR